MGHKKMKFFILLHFLAWASASYCICLESAKGPITIKVAQCATFDPKIGSESFKSLPSWVKDLPPNLSKKILEGHRGILLSGRVTDSDAKIVSDLDSQSALKGTDIQVFIHAGFQLACPQVNKNLVNGDLGQTCCDGSGNAPCLWKTGYFLKSPKIVKKSQLNEPQNPSAEADLTPAYKLYRKNKYQKVVSLLLPSWTDHASNVEYIWLLTQSLKRKDLCIKALSPLKSFRDLYDQEKLSLEFEDKIADTIYLLSRCYAKLGKPDESIAILEGLLLNKKLFKNQIKNARANPDFNSVRSKKNFQEFIRNSR